jgi:hypothetical protein
MKGSLSGDGAKGADFSGIIGRHAENYSRCGKAETHGSFHASGLLHSMRTRFNLKEPEDDLDEPRNHRDLRWNGNHQLRIGRDLTRRNRINSLRGPPRASKVGPLRRPCLLQGHSSRPGPISLRFECWRRRHGPVKIRKSGQIGVHTGFHFENVG